jgi:hypothetical protein
VVVQLATKGINFFFGGEQYKVIMPLAYGKLKKVAGYFKALRSLKEQILVLVNEEISDTLTMIFKLETIFKFYIQLNNNNVRISDFVTVREDVKLI